MKTWRVAVSSAVVVLLLAFACFVPVPVSRIRGHAMIQPDPSATGKVYVRHEGILTEMRVRPGDTVRAGDILAVFTDRELDADLLKTRIERDVHAEHIKMLETRKTKLTDPSEIGKVTEQLATHETQRLEAAAKAESLKKVRDQDLVLRAPCSGIVGHAPSIDDISRLFPADPSTPFCTINEPGRVRVCVPVITPDFNRLKEDLEQVSSAARASRHLMRRCVNLAYDNTRLADVLADLQKQVKGLHMRLDKDGGLSEDLTVSYQAKNQRLGLALDSLFERVGLGYVVLSEPGGEHDGWLLVRAGRERGEPEGGRPLADLDVTIRIQGRDSQTWKGKIRQLPESEAKTVPLALSNRGGGPVAVKAAAPGGALIPSTQQYLVYVEIVDPDEAIMPGQMAQVKIHCQSETCLHWLWRTINNTFDLGLM